MHPDKIEELSLQAIANFAKLEVRVASLETSINMLRVENEKILSKISESLEKLATINEKMSNNNNDHKNIHRRIDEVAAIVDDTADRIHKIELEHEVCMARQRREDSDQRIKEIDNEHSTWALFKSSAIPVLVGIALTFASWMIIQHMPEYLADKSANINGGKP